MTKAFVFPKTTVHGPQNGNSLRGPTQKMNSPCSWIVGSSGEGEQKMYLFLRASKYLSVLMRSMKQSCWLCSGTPTKTPESISLRRWQDQQGSHGQGSMESICCGGKWVCGQNQRAEQAEWGNRSQACFGQIDELPGGWGSGASRSSASNRLAVGKGESAQPRLEQSQPLAK